VNFFKNFIKRQYEYVFLNKFVNPNELLKIRSTKLQLTNLGGGHFDVVVTHADQRKEKDQVYLSKGDTLDINIQWGFEFNKMYNQIKVTK